MAAATIQIAPECIADGKRLYELTLTPVADIAATMGISRRTLERRIHEWGWTPRSAPRLAADRTLTRNRAAGRGGQCRIEAGCRRFAVAGGTH